ncbi:hypothetical protein OS493_036888 [Desmophyllum pertusum]|uniref:Uncharacterized protein n=1 Tax=Desmophyllum pertusum TaxID=174260 RepID=A0A9W9YHZ5_9CNID|nr:hypothetical protein OS493_036888 [Desmophyllum pertusum]
MPIDCVLASTVVFNKTPLAKCKLISGSLLVRLLPSVQRCVRQVHDQSWKFQRRPRKPSIAIATSDVDKYLSYENFPVLCRDAAAVMLPPAVKTNHRRNTFANKCSTAVVDATKVFYTCLKKPGDMYTYGFCMRGAYTCMCDCIENKTFKELPYKP